MTSHPAQELLVGMSYVKLYTVKGRATYEYELRSTIYCEGKATDTPLSFSISFQFTLAKKYTRTLPSSWICSSEHFLSKVVYTY